MTVTEVLLNFRRALIGVVPAVEAAHIPWRRPHAYDEWDAIATTLYTALVIQVVRWSLPEGMQQGFKMHAYDVLTNRYTDLGFVQVQHASLPSGNYAFHAFGTDRNPFDVVEVRLLTADFETDNESLVVCPVVGATFSVCTNIGAGGRRILDSLDAD